MRFPVPRIPRPRVVLAVMLALAAMAAAIAQQPKVPTNELKAPAKAPDVSADEKLIREGAAEFVKLYNDHKANEVTALFALDARMVFSDGTAVNGRDEIRESFEEAFLDTPQVAISVVVDSIRFLTPDVAVEEGVTNTFPDGDTLTSRGPYTVLHVKKNGRWLMQSVRVVEDEVVSTYGQLQPLEWLVGEWIDEGRTEVVEANFRWDENKSFLLEEFQIIREGSVVLKGTQRIGWDPQAKQIRSWIFDSAGGFGEAVWTPVGDDWVSKANAVRSDGTSASATRTLTRAAQDRVILSATDRLDDGEALPDLAVTMVRKPPKAQ